MHDYDYILVGGGLQNSLIALSLLHHQPESRIALIEKDPTLGGNHTWCFHAADLTHEDEGWVEPLVRFRWQGYRVDFPGYSRTIDAPYRGVDSITLHDVVAAALARSPRCALLTAKRVIGVHAHHVEMENHSALTGTVVIDSRGPDHGQMRGGGFQKFVGLELELPTPHGLQQPRLIDATVPQRDGFRFLYTLPLSSTRVLVEDTYFSDNALLDHDDLHKEVLAYANAQGLRDGKIVRQESGVLPMPWAMTLVPPAASPIIAGYRGGWFHPATGYSFPVALRLARFIGSTHRDHLFGPELHALTRQHRQQFQYCQRLNRMLFQWFEPEQRWHVFQRFYKLPVALIHRFYALDLRATDRARILLGRPPRGLSIRAGLAKRNLPR